MSKGSRRSFSMVVNGDIPECLPAMAGSPSLYSKSVCGSERWLYPQAPSRRGVLGNKTDAQEELLGSRLSVVARPTAFVWGLPFSEQNPGHGQERSTCSNTLHSPQNPPGVDTMNRPISWEEG